MSLSARRAWIEISQMFARRWVTWVALRKESVDRNNKIVNADIIAALSLSARRAWIEISTYVILLPRCQSLSARRAWIEISVVAYSYYNRPVALRKESVDRNNDIL